MPGAPGLLAGITPPIPQHHRRNRLPLAPQVVHRSLPRTNQLADSLVCLIGHPDRGELASPQQPCELRCIAAVRLHPVARPARDQRGRDHCALVTHSDQLPVKPIPGWASLVAEVEPRMTLPEPVYHPTDGRGVSLDLTKISYLTQPTLVGNGHGMPRLGDIQSDKNLVMLIHGSSSCAEERLAPREQPSLPRSVGRATPVRNGHAVAYVNRA